MLLKLFVDSLINENKETGLIYDLKNKNYDIMMSRFDNYTMKLKDKVFVEEMKKILKSYLDKMLIIKFLIYSKNREDNEKILPYKSTRISTKPK